MNLEAVNRALANGDLVVEIRVRRQQQLTDHVVLVSPSSTSISLRPPTLEERQSGVRWTAIEEKDY